MRGSEGGLGGCFFCNARFLMNKFKMNIMEMARNAMQELDNSIVSPVTSLSGAKGA